MSALKYLVVIGLILAAVGFASEPLGEYIGPIEYQGYLGFGYPEGDNPINNIVFTVDSVIAGNLIILDVPSMWSHSYSGGVLTLSGGSLGPGGEVLVTVSLNKYFEDGEYAVSSVGTTTAGETSQASGPLLVGDLNLLNMLGMVSSYRYPLAGLVAGLAVLELFLSRQKAARAVGSGGMPSAAASDADVYDTERVEYQGTKPDQKSPDNSEYDDSDLPGLDEVGNDIKSTDSSDAGHSNGSYEVPPERKYWIKYELITNNTIRKWEEYVTMKEYRAGREGTPVGPPPVWDYGETYLDYRRYWYELYGEQFDRELLSIQSDPEKHRHLVNYVNTYANILTVTRDRADISWDDRIYDEEMFSKEFKDALDKILFNPANTILFRKYLGDPDRKVYEIDTSTPEKPSQPRKVIGHKGSSTWRERIISDDFEVKAWVDKSVINDVKLSDDSSINSKPESNLDTSVYGVLGAGLSFFPFILKSDNDEENPGISDKCEELGILESDFNKLGGCKLDFGVSPTEFELDDIRITPRLAGHYTLKSEGKPILRTRLDFKNQSEISVPLPFNGEILKPALGQIIESNDSVDGIIDGYYRVYYKSYIQNGVGINVVDLQGNLIYPGDEGDMIIEFDPLFGISPNSEIPLLVETRISKFFKFTETPQPPETIILLDVKIAPSED